MAGACGFAPRSECEGPPAVRGVAGLGGALGAAEGRFSWLAACSARRDEPGIAPALAAGRGAGSDLLSERLWVSRLMLRGMTGSGRREGASGRIPSCGVSEQPKPSEGRLAGGPEQPGGSKALGSSRLFSLCLLQLPELH